MFTHLQHKPHHSESLVLPMLEKVVFHLSRKGGLAAVIEDFSKWRITKIRLARTSEQKAIEILNSVDLTQLEKHPAGPSSCKSSDSNIWSQDPIP